MAWEKRGGIISLKLAGTQFDAKGAFSYQLSGTKRSTIVGADGLHGFKEMPDVGFIEGAITDSAGMDLAALKAFTGVSTLELANGKVIVCDGAQVGECQGGTEEGEIKVRFEGEVEEVRS